MKEATLGFQSQYFHIGKNGYAGIKLDINSGVMSLTDDDGTKRSFATVLIGVVQQNVFVWGDLVEGVSDEYALRVDPVRESLISYDIYEANYDVLRIDEAAIRQARSKEKEDGFSLLDKYNQLFSRFCPDEIASLLFHVNDFKAIYKLNLGDHESFVAITNELS